MMAVRPTPTPTPTPTGRWWRRVTAVLAAVVVVGLAPLADDVRPAGAGGSRAVVNVNGSVHVISFGGSISGLAALQRVASVETLEFGGIGTAVCKINGVGNPATPNQCLIGPNGEYWRYFRAAPGATGWQYSQQGAGGATVTDGSVEGWRYGTGGAPTFVSFCAAAGCGPPPTVAPPPPPPPAGASTDAGTTATSTTAAKDAKKSTKSGSKDGKGTKAEEGGAGGTAGDEGDKVDARGEEVAGDRRLDGREDDSGSPVGVIVAVVIALGVVGGGLWYRRRRIKMGV
jgi:hypothetical protein